MILLFMIGIALDTGRNMHIIYVLGYYDIYYIMND